MHGDEFGTSIDEIVIEMPIGGERVRLTRAELDEIIARLANTGRSARRVADLIGTSSRNVVRRRAVQRAL